MPSKNDEFSLIRDIIQPHFQHNRHDVLLGIGDDCALTTVQPGMCLAISSDTLVAGQHFFADTCAEDIGHKTLAVNLSDLAAMGASPCWASLSITMPRADSAWLTSFMQGFANLAQSFNVQLIGGDLTKGPLCLGVQVIGQAPKGAALCRHGAQAGDDLYVSGTLGAPGLAVAIRSGKKSLLSKKDQHYIEQKLDRPSPHIALGEQLRHVATACIDISDGFLSDLNHILSQSHVGAIVRQHHVPIDDVLTRNLNNDEALDFALNTGDAYILCFSAPKKRRAEISVLAAKANTPIHRVGKITAEQELWLDRPTGTMVPIKPAGFMQFD